MKTIKLFVIKMLAYYRDYLAYKNYGVNESQQRDQPLNYYYYYRVIGTVIDGQDVYSVSPGMDFQVKDNLEETLLFNQAHYKFRRLNRMTLQDYQPLAVNLARSWTEADAEASLKNKDQAFKAAFMVRYKDILNQGRRFIVEDQGLAAIATVTDIDHGGGNIAVFTNKAHRGKGYGKMVVDACIRWCLDNNILPIYLVDQENTASIRLAKSLGFKTFSQELALSEEIR